MTNQQQTFSVQYLDEEGNELYQLYRNYVGTAEGLRSMILDEIERGEHPQRVVGAIVAQTSGLSVHLSGQVGM